MMTKTDPISFRTDFLEGFHRVHVGHFASIPIVLPSNNSQQSSSSNHNNNNNIQDEETNLMASVDGTTCFLDQDYQDCKTRLLMQSFFLPKASIINISNCGRKEVQNFIKMSKSISVLDKANEEVGVGKNEFAYLSDLWNQMFKLPQTMLKYSGKHESFWRGGIFSTLYRFITRDYEHIFDENRDFQCIDSGSTQDSKYSGDLITSSFLSGDIVSNSTNINKMKLDGTFFIGFNHQRNKEIRELTRRMVSALATEASTTRSVILPQTTCVASDTIVSPTSSKQQKQFLDQAFQSGTLLPFFGSCERNDTTGNQYQAENELSLMLKLFLETQYTFFQKLGSKPKKRFVSGLTCVGPLVTCFVMRRYHTVVESFESDISLKKNSSSNVEPIYVMQPLDTFNLSNYDDLLRCAKYLTGVRKLGESLFAEVRNALRHLCGLPLLGCNEKKTLNSAQQLSNENNQSDSDPSHDNGSLVSSNHMGNAHNPNEKVKNSNQQHAKSSSNASKSNVSVNQQLSVSPKANSNRREERTPSSGEKRKQPPTPANGTSSISSNGTATQESKSQSSSQVQKKQKVNASTAISPERTSRPAAEQTPGELTMMNSNNITNNEETSQRSTQQDSVSSSANDSERMIVDNHEASSDLDE
nr:unnamed protein product [Naegleria fowleri]